jgi:seryl-tRNA synthetase
VIDPKLLRTEIERVANELAKRGFTLPVTEINSLEEERKQLQVKTQDLQNQKNIKSKMIGQAKAKGEDISNIVHEMNHFTTELKATEHDLLSLQNKIQDLYLTIPNLPHESVPIGTSEEDNVEIRRHGSIPNFTFPVKDHIAIGEDLKALDFDLAAKLSGARFVVMFDDLARLHRALIQFMLDTHTQQHGYHEVYVPYLVKEECLFGTGQLPKFREDQFWVTGGDHAHNLVLIPTAEVPLTNLARDSILELEDLPMKWVAHTPCFRSEAGSYGKDTKGLIRQHQFEKVELVQIVQPEKSYDALEELTANAESILQKLELSYRVMALCTADIGFGAAKTYDLEVWMPGQNSYREISSCSNFEDFQARRLQARYRSAKGEKPVLAHTLNGSGLAVGRTLIAIMENYQDEQGRINIPSALQAYMGGQKVIG